ncbi:hypothetical protein BKH20_00905 [Actinomyces oris]|uniref:Uncharacterized protein n=1 Tax=Actinomyces oris TaxID=544580 RepID=A0A1Q8WY31_9ACTO|nr:hypothetical protein BKH20_00905 [Actinomyces oris]
MPLGVPLLGSWDVTHLWGLSLMGCLTTALVALSPTPSASVAARCTMLFAQIAVFPTATAPPADVSGRSAPLSSFHTGLSMIAEHALANASRASVSLMRISLVSVDSVLYRAFLVL